MENFLVIDGNSLLFRAFYALPLLTNKNGEYSNAVYGFTNMLIKVISEQKPTYICVAFDAGKKNFRHEIYADYKGTRKETPSELITQFALVRKMLGRMNIKFIEKSGIEADDIIGTLSKHTDIKTMILSGDKDILQLIDPSTEAWLTKKGISEIQVVNEKNIEELFSLRPDQIVDFKALCGETSDNIPGVKGIGEKTATSLLKDYGSLNGVYENIESINGKLKEKLELGKADAELSQKLATINQDSQIDFKLDDFTYNFPFDKEVFAFFEEYDFRSLLKRKELFVDEFIERNIPNDIPCENIIISSSDKIKDLYKAIYEEGVIAFDIAKTINFSLSQNIMYSIDNEITLFNTEDKVETCVLALKQVFEDEKIDKIFYDYKKALHFLDQYGVCVKGNVFDISIARYLLSCGAKVTNQHIQTNQFFIERAKLLDELRKLKMIELYNEFDMPLSDTLFKMEKNGFKVEKKELNELAEKYKTEQEELSKQIYAQAGTEFNINSPKQLADILFVKLGLVNPKKSSTNIDVLNELEDLNPIIPLLKRYRKIQKLSSTYVEAYLQILSNVGEIIHTVFNQTLTATGRLSSSEPNLQNIPVRDEEGKNLRKIFVSKFDGGHIISADYNQIELRLLAAFSQDDKLVKAFKEGDDIHRATASQIFNKPMNEITSNERRSAKAVNFGVIYGISEYGLSQNIGISRKDAKDYIARYFSIYPQVKEYMDNNVKFAKENGYVETMFKRRRTIPELKSNNFNLRTFGERVAMNMPLQGSASDIIKLAMINVSNAIKAKNLKSQLILQIHDELIVDAFPGESQEVRQILKDNMENAVKLSVDLPVDINEGENWFEAK